MCTFLEPCTKLGVGQVLKDWNNTVNGFLSLCAGTTSRDIAFLHGLHNGFADLGKTGKPFSGDGRGAKHAGYSKIFGVVPKVLLIERAEVVGAV